MNWTTAPARRTERLVPSSAADTRLSGGLLVCARGGWIAAATLTTGSFVAALPMLSRQLHTVCVRYPACPGGGLSPTGLQTLHMLGFSVGTYAAYVLALYTATMVVWCAVGGIIFWRKSDDWMALLVALFLVTFNIIPGVGQSAPAFVYPVWDGPLKFLSFLAVIPLGLFFLLFPTGQFVPRWTRWFVVLLVVLAVARSFLPASPFDFTTWPDGLNVLTSLSSIGMLLYAQLYRYRRVSTSVQRQQTKWVVFGVTTALAVFLAGEVFYLLFPAWSQPGSLYSFGFETVIPLVLLALPLSIGVAVLRYRLWDLDILINRTLVSGSLTASVIGLYVLIVGGLGTLLQARGNVFVSLLATGLVALLFQPLRTRLQRSVNRLMYGERDDPQTLLARLGQRLDTTLTADTVLPPLVETLARALKVPAAAITLQQQEQSSTTVKFGTLSAAPVEFPLVYQGETLGTLCLDPRTPGEPFTAKDFHVLESVVRQISLAAHAARLTADLQRSNAHLRVARTQLVTAREEERRRLRRDLHDGLGPQLSSQPLTLSAIRKVLRQDPEAADQLLAEAITHAQAAITDIRRLVYALRPPSLDDLGLRAALQEQMTRYRASGVALSLEVSEPLPPLPAAVEVACYWVVQEALTNVVRHSQAQVCTIRLSVERELVVEICDDGQGLPSARHSGVGLTSMRERAEELGGTCTISGQPEGGTRVLACLPLE